MLILFLIMKNWSVTFVMKLNILSSLKTIALLGALSMVGSQAFAQGGAAAPPQGVAGDKVQPMKIAIIDIYAFRVGINELKVKYEKLEAEFTPRQQQLMSMQNKVQAQEKTLQENKALTPDQARKLAEEVEFGKKDITRSLEDARSTAQKRETQETGAIYDKIGEALKQYCAKNGITHLFDGRKLMESNIIVHIAESANITDNFMNEYNKANPSTGGAAPTASKPATK